MQLTTAKTPEVVTNAVLNELQLGDNICVAVKEGRRSDFSLLVALFSEDIRETIAVEPIQTNKPDESDLRTEFHVPTNVTLRSDQDSYEKGAHIAKHFHEGGIQSARLQNGLNPDCLAYMTENTHNLGEEVYRNLSFHTKRTLSDTSTPTINANLYQKLIINAKESQISAFG